MKVLHLITRLDRGGAPKVFFRLVRGLKERGVQVVIACGPSRDPQEDPTRFSRTTGISFHLLPSLRRDISPLHDLLAFWEIISLIKRERPQLLHTHTTKAGILGRLAGRLAGTKTIHTPHGHLFYGYFGKGMERLYTLMERLAARCCQRIIAISEDERREYLKRKIGDEDKVITIYNGIDITPFPGDGERVRGELGISYTIPLIGFVGRLDPIKGPHLFVAVARKIKETIPHAHFLMAGDGPLRGELAEMAQSTPNFHILGYREDIPDLLAALDLLLVPSLNDGFNLAVVEAMAACCPVIAFAVGGLPEVVGDGGIMVPPGDIAGMAKEAIILLQDPQHSKEIGACGRRRVETLFTWERSLQETICLYHQVMEAPR